MTFSDYSILLGNRMNIALFYLHSAYTKAMRQPQLRQGEIAWLLPKNSHFFTTSKLDPINNQF